MVTKWKKRIKNDIKMEHGKKLWKEINMNLKYT